MSRINWRSVFIVIGAVFLLAHRRSIGEAIAHLRVGEMWREFCGIIWGMPQFGRYVLALAVLALLYLTAYFLILNWRRR